MRLLLHYIIGILAVANGAIGADVEPMMGGGQVTQGAVGMKHADISFESGALHVEIDTSIGTPMLRPLPATDQFHPDSPWSLLSEHSYNFQYGWNPGRFDAYPPAGSWIWIEQLEASPGLEVYQRPPAAPEGLPIFGTQDSPTRWRWGGSMTHNLYAVIAPDRADYFAFYRIYIGDDTDGVPLSGFAPAEVAFHFAATPFLPGDYDRSGGVDTVDYAIWRSGLGSDVAPGSGADGSRNGLVDLADYAIWRDHFGSSPPMQGTTAVPEPAGCCLLLGAITCMMARALTAARGRSTD